VEPAIAKLRKGSCSPAFLPAAEKALVAGGRGSVRSPHIGALHRHVAKAIGMTAALPLEQYDDWAVERR
jgi:hypothetical protein